MTKFYRDHAFCPAMARPGDHGGWPGAAWMPAEAASRFFALE